MKSPRPRASGKPPSRPRSTAGRWILSALLWTKIARSNLFCRTAADGLDVLRHSTAHLMAQAVQSLFPGTQVTIGPTIEDGFYYDFKSDRTFSPEDLELIEKRMQELAKADLKVVREEMPRAEAIELFRKMGEDYKVEIIEGIPEENGFALPPGRLGRSLPRPARAEHRRRSRPSN